MHRSNIRLTVPEYAKKFLDSRVDLNETPKVCCFFHQEDTPSFSYNPATGRWRCFGSCKSGGDVIDMHRLHYKLRTREEAERSLCSLLGQPYRRVNAIEALQEEVSIDIEDLELNRIYNLCLLNANCVDRWLDMDYAMSIYPVDVYRLKDLLSEWGVKYER